MDVLEQLAPDLIITQALCDVCAVAGEEVMDAARKLPTRPEVINLEPMSLEEVFETIKLVGQATGRDDKASGVLSELRGRVDKVRSKTETGLDPGDYPRVAFLEWLDPPFNGGHWTPELIEIAGGIDCTGSRHRASRTLDWQLIIDAQPDVIFIACCGFTVERTGEEIDVLRNQPGWQELPCVKNKRVYITDGNAYFSRSGPRLVDSLEIIANTLHPQLHPLPRGLPAAQSII